MNGAAVSALASIFVGIKRLVERRQVSDQVIDLDFDTMNQFAAFEAVPVEAVALARPGRLDDEPYRAGLRPLR